MMRLTVLGSGSVVPAADVVCSSYYVEIGEARILLDCGPGAVHNMARFGLPWSELTHIAITHFHNDHIGDFPPLMFAMKHGMAVSREQPLVVLGPAGLRKLLKRAARAFGSHVTDPGFPLQIEEINPGETFALGSESRATVHATQHTENSVAYRLDTATGSLGYTGDTGPNDDLANFMTGVSTLIAECSLPDAEAAPNHLSPSSVARLARLAGPTRLVPTHIYPQLSRTELPGLIRQAGWPGEVIVAHDGLRLEW
jgi:ribonuclease BN (tRNA processing enzyme)